MREATQEARATSSSFPRDSEALSAPQLLWEGVVPGPHLEEVSRGDPTHGTTGLKRVPQSSARGLQ